MFKKLNPLLHNELRLTIVSLLVKKGSIDFNFIKEYTKASAGNISVQITKLEQVKYIIVEKGFKNNYPHTKLKITKEGLESFQEYVSRLKEYL